MKNEKPGGDGKHSLAVRVIDMVVWDAISKIEEKSPANFWPKVSNKGKTEEELFAYAAGGCYYQAKGEDALVSDLIGLFRENFEQG